MTVLANIFNVEFAGRLRELAMLVESGKAGVVAVDSRLDADGITLKIEVIMGVQHSEGVPRFRIEGSLGD